MTGLKEKWNKGQVREYDPIFNRGCCYCVSKVWKECRFSNKKRIGNHCVKRIRRIVNYDKRSTRGC